MYIQRRRQKLYALHDIPEDVRHAFGGKARFTRSLDTGDMREAKRRGAVLEAAWRAEIEAARQGTSDPIERDARFYRDALRNASSDTERDLIRDEIGERYEAILRGEVVRNGRRYAPDLPEGQPVSETAENKASGFVGFATGRVVPFLDFRDEWEKTLTGPTRQTVSEWKRRLENFAATFPTLRDVTRKKVQEWINARAAEGKAPKTVLGYVVALRSYWRYLIAIEAVPEDPDPFTRLALPKDSRRGEEADILPYTLDEVGRLLKEAEGKGDRALSDLMRIAMHTGMRIEEICKLKVGDVEGGALHVREGKTKAAIRAIPIHPAIAGIVDRLKAETTDGYLFPGLTTDKRTGKRSNAMSARFSKMKRRLKFSDRQNFHSFRHTVSTMLEDAGVQENVINAILGHGKKTISLKVYSKAQLMRLKREALEKLSYPGI